MDKAIEIFLSRLLVSRPTFVPSEGAGLPFPRVGDMASFSRPPPRSVLNANPYNRLTEAHAGDVIHRTLCSQSEQRDATIFKFKIAIWITSIFGGFTGFDWRIRCTGSYRKSETYMSAATDIERRCVYPANQVNVVHSKIRTYVFDDKNGR
jgi:hypothetical protein